MSLRAAMLVSIAALTLAPCNAAEVWPSDAPANVAPKWSDRIDGRVLAAVDGSSATLASREGGFEFSVSGPNGSDRRLAYTFVGPQLGTIAADSDPTKIVGVFRQTDDGLEAQFADGSRQVLLANTAGGLSLTVQMSDGAKNCTAWYPGDHHFPAVERRAALAAYAEKLGLAQPNAKAAHDPACDGAIGGTSGHRRATAAIVPSAHMSSNARGSEVAGVPLMTISVRNSAIHPIDTVSAIPAAMKIEMNAPIFVASPSQSVSSVQAGLGASQCLSVESDGADLGFRNQCDYGVQFAYCLQQAPGAATGCDAVAKTGSVGAKAFAPVLLDANIRSADAEHDFRWVACSGAPGEIEARLDQAEPPTGRCLRTSFVHS